MTPILDFIATLSEDSDCELELALIELQKLIHSINDVENKPQHACEIWQAWTRLSENHQLNERMYPDAFLWHKPLILNYLGQVTKNYAFNSLEPDPISLEPISHPVILRSGHQFNASSMLQHFQAGHRYNPITRTPIEEEEFNELTLKLVQACYLRKICTESSFFSWNIDIVLQAVKQDLALCLLFLCVIVNWARNGCELDMPLIPVLMVSIPLIQEMFGNIFVLPKLSVDNNVMSLPISLSVFKVSSNIDSEISPPELAR